MKFPELVKKLRKYWIRRDREVFLLGGLTLTAMIAASVSSYWHFQDRVSIRSKIIINSRKSAETQQKALKEVQFMPSKLRPGAKQYYKVETGDGPTVPGLDDDEEN